MLLLITAQLTVRQGAFRTSERVQRMKITNLLCTLAVVCCSILAGCGGSGGSGSSPPPPTPPSGMGAIQHVIVVVGENHSFDAIFATYTPSAGQTIQNLLSEGIVNPDGMPGLNFSLAAQQQASDTTTYQITPAKTGPFTTLPQPNTAFLSLPVGPCAADPLLCPDPGLSTDDQNLLFEGGSGQEMAVPDCRYPSSLPNGPYQITGSYANNSCQSLEPINPITIPVIRSIGFFKCGSKAIAVSLPPRPLIRAAAYTIFIPG